MRSLRSLSLLLAIAAVSLAPPPHAGAQSYLTPRDSSLVKAAKTVKATVDSMALLVSPAIAKQCASGVLGWFKPACQWYSPLLKRGQVSDSSLVAIASVPAPAPKPDTIIRQTIRDTVIVRTPDTILVTRTDTLRFIRVDTLRLANIDTVFVSKSDTVQKPPADTATKRIALSVIRIDTTATGPTVLVSNAIPLAPGLLEASQLANVRVLVGGVEQSIYIEPLRSLHRDSSLRAVLVQFNSAVKAGAPLAGELVIGRPRTTSPLAKPTASRALPVAVALPSDANYLVTTELVGPMVTAAAARAAGGVYAQYESDFARWADYHWTNTPLQWADNYYDRAAIYFMQWARTANPEYWRRGDLYAVIYRNEYVIAGNYQASPYWLQDEGIALHYLATGDSVSWFTVGRLAQQYAGCFVTVQQNQNCYIQPLAGNQDVRNPARMLQAVFNAWRLNSPGDPAIGVTDWGAALQHGTDLMLANQEADGGYKSHEFCDGVAPYQVGLLNDQYIKQYRYFKADPRLLASVTRSTHWLWDTQWISATDGFHYTSVNCPDNGMGTAVGGLEAAPDLTSMLSLSFAWVAQQTKDSADASRARAVFAGGVTGANSVYSKQFNQANESAPLAIGLVPFVGPLAVKP